MSIYYINAAGDIMSSHTAEYRISDEGMSRAEAYAGYTKMDAAQILGAISAASGWDDIDEDMYRQLCADLDLDFDAYEDYAVLTEAATAKLNA